MKDHPTVYVVINDDGEVEKAFYEYQDAASFCKETVQSWGDEGCDPDDWDWFFQICKAQVT